MLHLSPNKITFWFQTMLMAVIAFSTTAGLASEQLDKSEPAKTLPVAGNSTTDCAGCHKIETQLWQQSHHARAMAEATRLASDGSRSITEAVLGDFNDAQAEDFALTANFRTVDGYPVMALTRERSTTHHIVSYSFGSTPLQQYLTDTDNGRQQVLPFAWDSRPKERGGQRWITLHPEEDILPADRLHWEQPLANWNGMCADCHSSGLTRNYSSADNSFATQYSDINVSCASCHSADPHNNNPIAAGSAAGFPTRYPLASSSSSSGAAASVKATSTPTAQTASSKRTLEVCAGCHSLRAPLVDGIDPTQPFLDQFSPTWLNPTLYFADGQIREEVYVWGSFLQSRMHAEGVTCGNCHDPHSQQLKATGNALCGQCHVAETFDSPDHHKHKPQSTAAQCVNCHMTSRTYMVVDDRRDHSFRVPDPAASHALGSPDACTSCHQGKSQNWATAALGDWSTATQPGNKNLGNASSTKQAWQLNQSGVPLSPDQFQALLNDEQLPELLRASAVVQQAQLQTAATEAQLRSLLTSKDPLVVLAATMSLANLPPAEREKLLMPLVNHRYRAIRIAAANQLRDTPAAAALTKTTDDSSDGPEVAALSSQTLAKALAEADMADTVSSWRGEGAMNSALSKQRSGDDRAAIEAYRRAIAIDPYFEPSYINLTELYRRQGDTRREQLLYTAALKALPDSPLLRYSYALHLVRRKDPAQALVQTTKALTIAPANQSSAYLHLLLLDNLGETRTGVQWLRANLSDHQRSPQVLQIGAKHAQKLGDTESLALFLQALQTSSQPTK